MHFLVGYSGFVGSNLNSLYKFDQTFNSKNIEDSFGKNPDLLVYSGIKAQKFIANANPDVDMQHINDAINNIKKINPNKIVLISTVDVYPNPDNTDEDYIINKDNLLPYGKHRLILEEWVQANIENHLIVRLPGLYGNNIKKNFIFDMINFIPSTLSKDTYLKFSKESDLIARLYKDQNNGFYSYDSISKDEHDLLKDCFKKLNFSAMKFTDHRASFQFYNLSYLWDHIKIALENNIKKLNLATEPVTAAELYEFIFNSKFENKISPNAPKYNFVSKYTKLFSGENGYIFSKPQILNDIKLFIDSYKKGD